VTPFQEMCLSPISGEEEGGFAVGGKEGLIHGPRVKNTINATSVAEIQRNNGWTKRGVGEKGNLICQWGSKKKDRRRQKKGEKDIH